MERNRFIPGDAVRFFAERNDWPIAEYNIFVEGENDKKYFELADHLYQRECGLRLIGERLSIFPTGVGDKGGVPGIQNDFPMFHRLIKMDYSEDGKKIFHAIALLDKDPAGIGTYRVLTSKHTNLIGNRDIFLLYRKYPRTTRNPDQLSRLIESENKDWKDLNCEIEDMICLDLLNNYVTDNSDSIQSEPTILNGGHHFKFHKHAKAPLFRFVQDYANIKDLVLLVEALKSFRYYLELDPDGE